MGMQSASAPASLGPRTTRYFSMPGFNSGPAGAAPPRPPPGQRLGHRARLAAAAAAEAIDAGKIGLAVRQPGHFSLGFRGSCGAGVHRCGSGNGNGHFLRQHAIVRPGHGQRIRGGGLGAHLPAAARCYPADLRTDGDAIGILGGPDQGRRLARLNRSGLRAEFGDPGRRLYARRPRGAARGGACAAARPIDIAVNARVA